jgi:hypothetical protein
MKGKTISRLLLLTAVSATIGVTPATASHVGQKSHLSRLCLERAGGCPKVPLATHVKQQGSGIRPTTDSRGQPAWQDGKWLMQ